VELFLDLDRKLRAEGFERRAPSGEVAAQMRASVGCSRVEVAD